MTVEANLWNKANSAWREVEDSSTIELSVSVANKASFGVKSGSIESETHASIVWVIDSGILDMTTGVKGDIEVPFACEIVSATLLADQTGSIVIDIWKDTFANAPPTNADSITASAPPTISSSTKSRDTTLTGWTKAISANDILRFNVDSVTSIKRVVLTLRVVRTLVNG